jgi:hypothetical protein
MFRKGGQEGGEERAEEERGEEAAAGEEKRREERGGWRRSGFPKLVVPQVIFRAIVEVFFLLQIFCRDF